MRVEENRSLVVVILLSIVTCGIYGYYFLYTVARDVNIVCQGDGKNTNGLLVFILLSIVTCGIYSWVWYYGLGNRMAENAPRYGLNFQENGTTILMWLLFGSLLCGIGPFVAQHIIINNMNALAHAYNNGGMNNGGMNNGGFNNGGFNNGGFNNGGFNNGYNNNGYNNAGMNNGYNNNGYNNNYNNGYNNNNNNNNNYQ